MWPRGHGADWLQQPNPKPAQQVGPRPPTLGEFSRLDGQRHQEGWKAGLRNKITALLSDAILQAGEQAGGEGGLVGDLTVQARETPSPFLPLLNKVLAMRLVTDSSVLSLGV